jgi:hypothetical protein
MNIIINQRNYATKWIGEIFASKSPKIKNSGRVFAIVVGSA